MYCVCVTPLPSPHTKYPAYNHGHPALHYSLQHKNTFFKLFNQLHAHKLDKDFLPVESLRNVHAISSVHASCITWPSCFTVFVCFHVACLVLWIVCQSPDPCLSHVLDSASPHSWQYVSVYDITFAFEDQWGIQTFAHNSNRSWPLFRLQLKQVHSALTQDRVHEQDFSSVNIRWELCVVYFSFQRLLISLY